MKTAKPLLMSAISAFDAATCLIVATAGSAANAGSFTDLLKTDLLKKSARGGWKDGEASCSARFDAGNMEVGYAYL